MTKKPKPLDDIKISDLKALCREYIDFVYSDEYYEDNDYNQYIFQVAMMTIFGNDVFRSFINPCIEDKT